MQEQRTLVRPGQRVIVRDEAWIVAGAEHFGHVSLLTLKGTGEDNRGATQQVLTPFDRVHAAPVRAGLARARRVTVLAHAARVVAAAPRWRDCWTAGTAAIDLRPWQIEPVLGVIAGTTRILLADEVGLGKTIQAALIVSELMARGLARRVLILTPASLRAQWAAELWNKFRIAAAIFDQASLTATCARLPVGVNPWSTAPVMISSIDLVKRPEVRTALDEVPLDVLIIDEAHHVTPGTDRGAAIADLAARTTWVVLSTATPHSGDEAAFRFLETLGSVGDSPPLVTFRRATAQVRKGATRRTLLLGVTPTGDERALLDSTLAYCRALWHLSAAPAGVALVASVMARRAASSAAAARRTFERRLALLEGSAQAAAQVPLPWDEDADDETSDDLLAVPGFASQADEVAWLRHLAQLARAAEPVSSKIRIIRRLLTRTEESLIVFSEYRDVVRDAATRIADLTSVAVIHGGVEASVRRDRIRAFAEGRRRVLVTTDAAGEGLNLQAHCRLVVNLELPWNPMRLEQRIGRVDRLGQQRTVHAIHLYHRESFEDVVLAHLERRRARASSSVRDSKASISITDLETERRLRTLAGRHHRPEVTRPLYARDGPLRRPASRVVLLFSSDVIDLAGRLVQRQLVPLTLAWPWRRAGTRRLSKAGVRELAADGSLRRALHREIHTSLSSVRRDAGRTAVALEQRVRALMSSLELRRRESPFQGSLFDRRSEHQAQARATMRQHWRSHFSRRLDTAHALMQVHATEPRLVAAWLAE